MEDDNKNIIYMNCLKCGLQTEYSGDLHCRKILIDEVKNLFSLGKHKEARKLVVNSIGDSKWDIWKYEHLHLRYKREIRVLELEEEERIEGERMAIRIIDEQNREKERIIFEQIEARRTIEEAKIEADLNIKIKVFEEIANKYQIDIKNFVDDKGPTELAPIVLKIENKEILFEIEIDWLKSKKYFNLLGMYYLLLYEHKIGYIDDLLGGSFTLIENDYWNLAKACSNFRDDENPQKTIEISNNFFKNKPQTKHSKGTAAVFTSRGGACKDTKKFEDAKINAFNAIEFCPDSFYPYNLLGSICYLENDYETGDKYFSKAIDLGSPERYEEFELKKVLKESEQNNRKSIIEYLLRKDSIKYKWVLDFKQKINI